MPATYVKITRSEFEDWLYELCPVFERDEEREGIYRCPMSAYVAIKICTTLGQNDAVIRKDYGRCQMGFVRRDNGKELHKPAKSSNRGYDRCNRTQGWRENWTDALRGLFASFKGDRDHYNHLGKQTQKEYALEWRDRIHSIKDWEGFDILRDLHDALGRDVWLSGKQERAIWRFTHPKRRSKKAAAKPAAKPAAKSSRKTSGAVDKQLLDALAALVAAAEKAGDSWTAEFATGNVMNRVRAGRAPSARQADILRDKFMNFKIAVPSAVAA